MNTPTVKPLAWRKPTDHPQDDEDALFVAAGLGGNYAISTRQMTRKSFDGSTMGHLLWDAEDNFSFTEHASVEDAKAAAQADFERRILSCLAWQAEVEGEAA